MGFDICRSVKVTSTCNGTSNKLRGVTLRNIN